MSGFQGLPASTTLAQQQPRSQQQTNRNALAESLRSQGFTGMRAAPPPNNTGVSIAQQEVSGVPALLEPTTVRFDPQNFQQDPFTPVEFQMPGSAINTAAAQNQNLGALQRRAMGIGGPSAAELQMQQGMERNVAAARALAASNPGLSPGQAARLASQGAQEANLATQQQTALLRAQEQAQAEQTLMQAIQGQQGAELQQAGLMLTPQELNLQAFLAQQGATQAHDLSQQQLAMQAALAQAQGAQAAQAGVLGAVGQLTGGLINLGGQAVASEG